MYVCMYILQECNYSNLLPVGVALFPCTCSRAKDHALRHGVACREARWRRLGRLRAQK